VASMVSKRFIIDMERKFVPSNLKDLMKKLKRYITKSAMF